MLEREHVGALVVFLLPKRGALKQRPHLSHCELLELHFSVCFSSLVHSEGWYKKHDVNIIAVSLWVVNAMTALHHCTSPVSLWTGWQRDWTRATLTHCQL